MKAIDHIYTQLAGFESSGAGKYSVVTKGRAALAALALIVSFFCAHAVQAQAYDEYGLQNAATGRCLIGGSGQNPPQGGSAYRVCSWETAGKWIASGMGNGGVRLKNTYLETCIDMSNLGLRSFTCHPANTTYAIYQSWKQHWEGGAFRLQAMGYGGGCLADYQGDGPALNVVACTTPGHSGYENQLWYRQY